MSLQWLHYLVKYQCLKATIENKTTSVTTHFKSASSSSKADTLNILYKNCMLWQLLKTITETINTLFPVVSYLICVATKVLFSIFTLRHWLFTNHNGSVATHFRCGEIFSDSTNFLLNLIWSNHHHHSKSLTAPSDMLHLIYGTSFLHHWDFLIRIIHPRLSDHHLNMPV